MTAQPIPSVGAMTDAILGAYNGATPEQRADGRAWYPLASDLCASIGRGSVAVDRVASVISALSPRCQWSTNVVWARRVVDAATSGAPEPPAVSTRANRAKAWAAVHGEDAVRGPKTEAFVRAIVGDPSAVVVDVWAMRAASVDPERKLTRRQYAEIASAYTAAAAVAGESPRDLQAIAWIATRGGAA